MPDVSFDPVPFTEAAELIRGKPAALREAFDRMIPEIQARAFTIAGIASADVLQEVRDRIAQIPEGADWEKVRKEVLADISPWLVTSDDPEERARQEAGALRRAALLLRTHAFQAYAATQWQAMQETKAAFPFWRYVTAGDGNVRHEHAALNGLVLPADSPFWRDHYPPWDWGCRCDVVALSPEEVERIRGEDAQRNPEDRLVLDGPLLERLEKTGELARGPIRMIDPNDPDRKKPMLDKKGKEVVLPAKTWNVTSPAGSGAKGAWSWTPGDLHIPLHVLRDRYKEPVWSSFAEAMQQSGRIDAGGRNIRSVWDWLLEPSLLQARQEVLAHGRRQQREMAVAIDYMTGERLGAKKGGTDAVTASDLIIRARSAGQRIVLVHNHPAGDTLSPDDLAVLVANRGVVAQIVANDGWSEYFAAHGMKFDPTASEVNRFVAEMKIYRDRLNRGSMTIKQWVEKIRGMRDYGWIDYEAHPRTPTT